MSFNINIVYIFFLYLNDLLINIIDFDELKKNILNDI